MGNKIEPNVVEFIDLCSDGIGQMQRDGFNQDIWNCCYSSIESPIEQLLFCALSTIKQSNYLGDYDEFICDNGNKFIVGMGIVPQFKIVNYRVDFFIHYGSHPLKNNTQRIYREVIVECDSQEFHDRTEKERRYEKQRDRFLQSKGYKVFRFTGSEIVKSPLEVGIEIVSYITDMEKGFIHTI